MSAPVPSGIAGSGDPEVTGAGERREEREVQAAESRIAFALAGAFTVLLAGTLYYVYTLFEPLMPAPRLQAWVIAMGSVTVLMAVIPLLVFLRKPGVDELVRIWDRVGKVVAVLYDLAVASSVWLLLPYASESLQLLMVIFYSAAISGQAISTAESTETIVFGVIVIFGSAALFFLQSEAVYGGSVAVFLLAFGVMLVGVSLVLKQAIRSAIRQRLKAERISRELTTALAEAQDARDARTRFIAAASHDLRQPLQAAMLFFRQLLDDPPPERRQRATEGVRRAFAETNTLLERMLEHLRLESGTMDVSLYPVALGRIFGGLADELRPAAREAGIDLRAQSTRHSISANRSLLTRCLRNLLHNALVHSSAKKVRVLSRRRAGMIEVFVIDDGRGIDQAFRETMFDAYRQGSTARSAGRGMGLGLSIASEMARLMGSTLVYEPRWQQGAAFKLTFPATSAPYEHEDPAPPAVEEGAGELAGLHVLVVDDEVETGEALAGVLTQRGADTRLMTAVSQLPEITHCWMPDIVVCDWHLGHGVTASNLMQMLRQAQPALPVIIMTGDGSRDTLKTLNALDAPVFWKPVDADAVVGCIQSLLPA